MVVVQVPVEQLQTLQVREEVLFMVPGVVVVVVVLKRTTQLLRVLREAHLNLIL
jgi:hypothetical protein